MDKILIQTGTHSIHLRSIIKGKRQSVLLIHGLGVSGDYYTTYATKLAEFYNVYIIDLPGYGSTPKPKKPLTIRELSQVVLAYVEMSSIDDFVIVGQSMGCQIIAHAIAEKPHLFKKALFLAPTVNRNEKTLIMQSLRLFQDTFHEKIRVNAVVFSNYARMGVVRFLITAKDMVQDSLEQTITRVPIPVLVVNGSKDNIAPRLWCQYLAGCAIQGTSVEIPSAPHLLQCDKPDELVTITREFIDA
jgi:pimeloyl-ACP methyl ester carboxylesterase